MFKKYVQKNITEKFDSNEKLSPISINDQTEDIFPPPLVNVFSLMIPLENSFLPTSMDNLSVQTVAGTVRT